MTILRNNTPIEQYIITGRTINVKREDLATSWPAPSLAKLRGCLKRLEKVKADGYTKIGVLDTRISKSGWGVAYLAKELGDLEVHAYFPAIKADNGKLHQQQKMSQQLGAILHPMKGGRTAVLYSQAKKEIIASGGYMMPMGLTVEESVNAIAEEASTIPSQFLGGDLVVCTGSCMTLSGITVALAPKLNKIYGISAGMNTAKQEKRCGVAGVQLPTNVELILPPGIDYYSQETIETPFPSSIYYDKKAWRWLTENLDKLQDPVIFWNIGV
jgi:1-aminocyclopropane-1-carboxylate deaminase/D-cysteine desulfhydrase-like pyridoxal-dependent ACC family enzyme